MELKISKKVKISIAFLILCIVIFSTISVIRFPYTSNDLLLLEEQGCITTSEGELPIVDIVDTVNMTSVHYLLKSEDNAYYVITMTRFPFLKRYDMSRLMPTPEGEIYNYSDFFNKVTITRTKDVLNFSEEKHISGLVFLWPFILFVAMCNILNSYKEQKKNIAIK